MNEPQPQWLRWGRSSPPIAAAGSPPKQNTIGNTTTTNNNKTIPTFTGGSTIMQEWKDKDAAVLAPSTSSIGDGDLDAKRGSLTRGSSCGALEHCHLLEQQPSISPIAAAAAATTTTTTPNSTERQSKKQQQHRLLQIKSQLDFGRMHGLSNNNTAAAPPRCSLLQLRGGDKRPFSAFVSSEVNHMASLDPKKDGLDNTFFGPFRDIRATLDYSFHRNYTRDRQRLQDSIITKFLDEAVLTDAQNGKMCTTPTQPWLVFTAGAFGAGKSYTLHQLVQKGRFPLMAFVRVNPDVLRRQLPEFKFYLQQNPDQAGALTNKEAGYMAEILTLAGLQRGQNVIVDGSLRDAQWYRAYFDRLRQEFAGLRIAILHVTAPRETIFQRAMVSAALCFIEFLRNTTNIM